MSPTPKHIEEAQRIIRAAVYCLREPNEATGKQSSFEDDVLTLTNSFEPSLPTLLAAQEKLETLRKGTEVTWPDGSTSFVPRIELEKLSDRISQLRADRDELIKRLEAFNHYTQQDWRETVKEIVKLRTRETALLAVARAAKSDLEIPEYWENVHNALSALEPLGIKV